MVDGVTNSIKRQNRVLKSRRYKADSQAYLRAALNAAMVREAKLQKRVEDRNATAGR